jgi:hypothetical protein
MPDPDDVDDSARERQRERTDSVESMLEAEGAFDESEYPTAAAELRATYADSVADLPNETEALGTALDRLAGRDEQYDTPQEAREAITGELTGKAGGANEANAERSLTDIEDVEERGEEATEEPRSEDEDGTER